MYLPWSPPSGKLYKTSQLFKLTHFLTYHHIIIWLKFNYRCLLNVLRIPIKSDYLIVDFFQSINDNWLKFVCLNDESKLDIMIPDIRVGMFDDPAK